MAKSEKQLYEYDSSTGIFTPVEKKGSRLSAAVIYAFSASIAILTILLPIYLTRESARMEAVRKENEFLESEYRQLLRRTDEITEVMKDIADRDNNFYRVLIQADPIPDSRRYAGLQRQLRLNSLDSVPDASLVSFVSANVDLLEGMLYTQSQSFDFIKEEFARQKDRLDYMPAIMPLAEKNLRAIVSGFGSRSDPIYGISKPHEGMDFSAPDGTPVYATGKGTVAFAGWKNGYGYMIDIDHGFGYVTRFAHLSAMSVKEGQRVERGQEIGAVGSTGKSTGPHLHYEVRFRDIPQNPVNYYFYDLTPGQYDEMTLHAQNAGRVMD